jgi:fluoride exporter
VITYVWIAAGSALGGMARYACSNLAVAWLGPTFPWGTLFINVLGSFVIGLFGALTGPDGRIVAPGDVRQFVMVGLCGGYTTFSSFSLQTLTLAQDGEVVRAGLNVVASVALCLAAVWLGYIAAAAFNVLKGS